MVATPASFALLLVTALTAEVTTRSASAQSIAMSADQRHDAGECTTVNEGLPEACPPIQPSRSRQRTRWTVVVLAQRRPRPLARLLSSIARANLSAADVNLRIEVRARGVANNCGKIGSPTHPPHHRHSRGDDAAVGGGSSLGGSSLAASRPGAAPVAINPYPPGSEQLTLSQTIVKTIGPILSIPPTHAGASLSPSTPSPQALSS